MLTIEEKIELIKKLAEIHEVSAYEFGENTNVSKMGAHNILIGDSKSPRNKTLNTMLEYLEKKISGETLTEQHNLVEEDHEAYSTNPDLDELLLMFSKKLTTKLHTIEKRLHLLENKK